MSTSPTLNSHPATQCGPAQLPQVGGGFEATPGGRHPPTETIFRAAVGAGQVSPQQHRNLMIPKDSSLSGTSPAIASPKAPILLLMDKKADLSLSVAVVNAHAVGSQAPKQDDHVSAKGDAKPIVDDKSKAAKVKGTADTNVVIRFCLRLSKEKMAELIERGRWENMPKATQLDMVRRSLGGLTFEDLGEIMRTWRQRTKEEKINVLPRRKTMDVGAQVEITEAALVRILRPVGFESLLKGSQINVVRTALTELRDSDVHRIVEKWHGGFGK